MLQLLAYVVFAGFASPVDPIESNFPFVDISNLSGVFRDGQVVEESIQGTADEFQSAWVSTVSSAKRIDTLSGRLMLRMYSTKEWNAIQNEKPPIEGCIEMGIVDFASDYVDLRHRVDYSILEVDDYDVENSEFARERS
jgi:hypothetical protein